MAKLICPKCEGRPPGAVIEVDGEGSCLSCGQPIDERSLRIPPDVPREDFAAWDEQQNAADREALLDKFATAALTALATTNRPEVVVPQAWDLAEKMWEERQKRKGSK